MYIQNSANKREKENDKSDCKESESALLFDESNKIEFMENIDEKSLNDQSDCEESESALLFDESNEIEFMKNIDEKALNDEYKLPPVSDSFSNVNINVNIDGYIYLVGSLSY